MPRCPHPGMPLSPAWGWQPGCLPTIMQGCPGSSPMAGSPGPVVLTSTVLNSVPPVSAQLAHERRGLPGAHQALSLIYFFIHFSSHSLTGGPSTARATRSSAGKGLWLRPAHAISQASRRAFSLPWTPQMWLWRQQTCFCVSGCLVSPRIGCCSAADGSALPHSPAQHPVSPAVLLLPIHPQLSLYALGCHPGWVGRAGAARTSPPAHTRQGGQSWAGQACLPHLAPGDQVSVAGALGAVFFPGNQRFSQFGSQAASDAWASAVPAPPQPLLFQAKAVQIQRHSSLAVAGVTRKPAGPIGVCSERS